jgi:hypothetical protein
MAAKKKGPHKKRIISRGKLWWIGGLVLIMSILGSYTLHRQMETPAQKQKIPAELASRWQRPDGGYVLELTGIGPDGLVKASYFNPRPINVSRSQWQRQNDRFEVFVELRDVNYPGSRYTLAYQPERNRLHGIYYKAAMGQMFEVEFVRTD